ncbi:hypothetical protein C8R44DRAFT_850965 [Mycena epipterygia]|nr:hypothetical protein C8R44DRAFT_850965 [Mycena epipterygia]
MLQNNCPTVSHYRDHTWEQDGWTVLVPPPGSQPVGDLPPPYTLRIVGRTSRAEWSGPTAICGVERDAASSIDTSLPAPTIPAKARKGKSKHSGGTANAPAKKHAKKLTNTAAEASNPDKVKRHAAAPTSTPYIKYGAFLLPAGKSHLHSFPAFSDPKFCTRRNLINTQIYQSRSGYQNSERRGEPVSRTPERQEIEFIAERRFGSGAGGWVTDGPGILMGLRFDRGSRFLIQCLFEFAAVLPNSCISPQTTYSTP